MTDPERFAAVVAEASRLVDGLDRAYDVRGQPDADWPLARPGGRRRERVVRLDPVEGAPLVLAVTDLPGASGWSGRGDAPCFPACGCDACDETTEDVVASLQEWVASVVTGGRDAGLPWPRSAGAPVGPTT